LKIRPRLGKTTGSAGNKVFDLSPRLATVKQKSSFSGKEPGIGSLAGLGAASTLSTSTVTLPNLFLVATLWIQSP